MDPLIQLLTVLGLGTIVPGAVTWWLQRKAAREDRVEERRDETSAAVLEEGAKMRGELWQQLSDARVRNDALSQKVGLMYGEKAELEGKLKVAEGQVTDMFNRLTVAQQQTDECRRDREKDRERLGAKITEREATIAQLTVELQQLRLQAGVAPAPAPAAPGTTLIIAPLTPREGDTP